MTERCDWTWPNHRLPDYPHVCAMQSIWHVRHTCHCGEGMYTGHEVASFQLQSAPADPGPAA